MSGRDESDGEERKKKNLTAEPVGRSDCERLGERWKEIWQGSQFLGETVVIIIIIFIIAAALAAHRSPPTLKHTINTQQQEMHCGRRKEREKKEK